MDEFEEVLTCCMCFEEYRNPKVLPCQHTYCMEPCMVSLIDYPRNILKCPECRREHSIPYQGVHTFPTNVTIQRLLESKKNVTRNIPVQKPGWKIGMKVTPKPTKIVHKYTLSTKVPLNIPTAVRQHWNQPLFNSGSSLSIDGSHNWVSSSSYQGVPHEAVLAGRDSDGDAIYAGRASHNGDLLPAKIVPSKHKAYVAWGGEEHEKHQYEILCGSHYIWVSGHNGSVPPNAMATGKTRDGEVLYIGRGHHAGSLTPGKVHPSHGCLYIPYGGKEISLKSYEVLTIPEVWVRAHGRNVPPHAVFAGVDSDGDQIFVGRAEHDGDLLPAKVIINKNCAYVCHGGHEYSKQSFEVLVGYGYNWNPASYGSVSPNAVVAGRTREGETLYIGRGSYHGSLTPGKIHPSHKCLYIPYGGREIRLENYECLVKSFY